MTKSHRVSARAVVIHQNKLLLNEFGGGLYYNLPGGGVEAGELIKEAILREVMEETGLKVEVGKMLYVLEYEPVYCDNLHGETPRICIAFECTLKGDANIKTPTVPDKNPDNPAIISKPVWMPVENLKNIEYVPYIHNNLMAFIETGVFEPSFLSEPLSN
ncbi:MAG: NUDIX domain-containing protein [Defluviitaleaceae bacterium]|nr:NUDIX domain-containing protein [Defluviitaleaceae bacterium]